MKTPVLVSLIALVSGACTHARAARSLGCPESQVIEIEHKLPVKQWDDKASDGLWLLLPLALLGAQVPSRVYTTVQEGFTRFAGCGRQVTCYDDGRCEGQHR